MLLSICIPTYNRINQLDNCLNSILISTKKINQTELSDFEVCISDNGSQEDILKITKKYEKYFYINVNKNKTNLGFALNAIKTISMARGEYSWLIGNDDLILPETLPYLFKLFKTNLDIEYFFINSYHLNSGFLDNFSSPFDTNNLQIEKMRKLSQIKQNQSGFFWDVIDKKVSWEFLIGIFLSIFKTKKWMKSLKIIDKEKINDTGVWSNFENTCLHPIILADAFKNSKAYICAKPLSVNLIGEREWGNLYEFIEIVRIPELIDYYRSQGLELKKYLICKNFALRNFMSYIFKILIGGRKKGRNYLNYKKHIFNNLIFPNVYLSLIYFLIRKTINILKFKKK
tara:strand:- start:148 stop:1176 length:1029 start_codon:yes stop_codon:yes gene_type:complete